MWRAQRECEENGELKTERLADAEIESRRKVGTLQRPKGNDMT